jgi:prepilin-type N-terminal cleavage/methylation domain-containing protein
LLHPATPLPIPPGADKNILSAAEAKIRILRQAEESDRTKMKNKAFTLVEIMIVVAIIGLLAAIAVPNFIKARATAQANACINNLRKIEDAAAQFAVEKGKKTGDAINYPSDLTPYIKLNSAGSIPGCPASGTYTINFIGARPQAICSLGSTVTPSHIIP